ncbi:MAG TPA: hypothetical protein VGE50_06185 [Gammaproteobacteria bacterium]
MVCALYLVLVPTPLAFLFTLIAVWLVWDSTRNNAVWGAFTAFRGGRFEEMSRLLAQVKHPQRLSSTSLAYYHWLKGVSEVATGRYGAAQVFLLLAASGALRSTNDRSLVQCLLGEVALQLQNREQAREHLRMARALQHSTQVERMINQLSAHVEHDTLS